MRLRTIVRSAAPVAAGAVLVAAAVGGTRAASRLELETRSLLSVPPVVESVLLAVAVLCLPLVLLGMLLRRRARAAGSEQPHEWLRRLVTLVVAVLAVVVLRELLPQLGDRAGVAATEPGAAQGISAALSWSTETAALVVGLCAVALMLLVWRVRSARSVASAAPEGAAPSASAVLRAGRFAMDRPSDDARAAVVACYAAMEDALATSGSPRRTAESPEELLRRATSEGRLPQTPARRLTDLFLRARYSTGRISEDDLNAGRDALRAIEDGVSR